MQFLEVSGGAVPEVPLGRRGQTDQHTAAVLGVVQAHGQPGPGEPVHQLNGAMMADAQTIGEIVDAERVAAGEALDREQRLVLARRKARAAGRPLAEFKEPAEEVAELRALSVLCPAETVGSV